MIHDFPLGNVPFLFDIVYAHKGQGGWAGNRQNNSYLDPESKGLKHASFVSHENMFERSK